MNYLTNKRENNCELNDANQYQEPGALIPQQGSHHYDLVRHHTTLVSLAGVPPKRGYIWTLTTLRVGEREMSLGKRVMVSTRASRQCVRAIQASCII